MNVETSGNHGREQTMQPPARQTVGDGPYTLRTLLDEVPLSTEDTGPDVKITCVDYLDRNLYVGTSAAELLHFVQIPADPSRPGQSQFILAYRLQPTFSESASAPPGSRPGVQQILLLPKVGKACVLCNGSVTFYSLPELGPAFGTTHVRNCNWIGGVDLNGLNGGHDGAQDRRSGVTILISLNRRIQVVRIGEDARLVKKIDFAGSTISARRGNIACVADNRNYALLDIEHQLKIPLMTISSLDNSQSPSEVGHAQNIAASNDGGLLRSSSSAQSRPPSMVGQGHARSTSLGAFIVGAGGMMRHDQRPSDSDDGVFRAPTPPVKPGTPQPATTDSSNQHQPPSRAATPQGTRPTSMTPVPSSPMPLPFLKPHIVSPTPEEFLLVTGTNATDPAIGMFVNLDGDPKGPTLGFERYPREVVVDSQTDPSRISRRSSTGEDEEEGGYVLASMTRDTEEGLRHGLEIQRFSNEGEPTRFWLEPPQSDQAQDVPPVSSSPLGIRSLTGSDETLFQEIVDKLCQRRFLPFPNDEDSDASPFSPRSIDSRTATSLEQMSNERELFERDLDGEDEDLPKGWEANRNREGEEFVRRLAKGRASLVVWTGSNIWWAVRSPLLLQLEARLGLSASEDSGPVDRPGVFAVLDSFKGRDARTELEFLTFSYLRQRAGLALLFDFLNPESQDTFSAKEVQEMTETLVDSSLDPRVVLSLVPGVRHEIIESRRGIWIFGGVRQAAARRLRGDKAPGSPVPVSALGPRVLQFLRQFLLAWRRKKGFGSVADEHDVFRTVDASLLLVLLEFDRSTPGGGVKARKSGSVRGELYDLVDKGVDCFDRAVDLLEQYRRLFVLSRLYQSRKMAGEVLDTWRRIVEGEEDEGCGELQDGEQRVREYLTKISNQNLVRTYGVWLANRNPKLGAQVFAEDKGRAPRFETAHAVAILRAEAPGAVKYYLEHLVFSRGKSEYVDELIAYYLDVAVGSVRDSVERREMLGGMYDAYRALQPPKPTFGQFLADNSAADDEVSAARLRLLQLLGEAREYDVRAIRSRIESVEGGAELLVPESIILDGREGRHEDALRLLVHKLGDYDSAVRYCLGGGASIMSGGARRPSAVRFSDEEQSRLFRALLGEFLGVASMSDRVEQTRALLERFGPWFDVLEVLEVVPDEWSVEVVAGFLEGAMRRLAREKGETRVMRGLSTGENLRVEGEFLEKVAEMGPTVEGVEEPE